MAVRSEPGLNTNRHMGWLFGQPDVCEDGAGLEKISEIFKDTHIEAFVDDVNKALKKVASGGSKGKTILKI